MKNQASKKFVLLHQHQKNGEKFGQSHPLVAIHKKLSTKQAHARTVRETADAERRMVNADSQRTHIS